MNYVPHQLRNAIRRYCLAQCRPPSKGKTFSIHKPSQPANASPKINIRRYRLGLKTNHSSSHANVTTEHFTNPFKHFHFWVSSLTPSTIYSFSLRFALHFQSQHFFFLVDPFSYSSRIYSKLPGCCFFRLFLSSFNCLKLERNIIRLAGRHLDLYLQHEVKHVFM